MRRLHLFRCAVLASFLGLHLASFASAATDASKSTKAFEWVVDPPEAHGFSRARLDALRDDLASRNTKIFLLIRDDRIIYEWYAPDFSASKPHYTASMAKAVIGGLAFATASDRVALHLDDPAARYIPQWREDPRKAGITLRQLGSHTSGLSDAEGPGDKGTEWMKEFWKRLPPPKDPFTLSRDVTPLISAPGAEFHYSNPGIAMFSYAITAALQSAPEKDIRTLLRERIMRPIGVGENEWDCGYGQTVTVDGLPLIGAWGGAAFTGRAAARVGRLMLREGDWEGQQLITRESVRRSTGDSGLPGAVNCGWWTNARSRVPGLPRDAYWAAGAGGQTLLIVPSMKLIMVRNGNRLSDQQNDHALATYVFEPLMQAKVAP
jgi:CubicO group peptidase (beta-lactamase class C family)